MNKLTYGIGIKMLYRAPHNPVFSVVTSVSKSNGERPCGIKYPGFERWHL
jgi:hypothetical protein